MSMSVHMHVLDFGWSVLSSTFKICFAVPTCLASSRHWQIQQATDHQARLPSISETPFEPISIDGGSESLNWTFPWPVQPPKEGTSPINFPHFLRLNWPQSLSAGRAHLADGVLAVHCCRVARIMVLSVVLVADSKGLVIDNQKYRLITVDKCVNSYSLSIMITGDHLQAKATCTEFIEVRSAPEHRLWNHASIN